MLTAGKTFHAWQKTRRNCWAFSLIIKNLAVVMMTMVAVMMGLGARGDNRDSQDDECNGSKKQST
jgi:hypothetical protein